MNRLIRQVNNRRKAYLYLKPYARYMRPGFYYYGNNGRIFYSSFGRKKLDKMSFLYHGIDIYNNKLKRTKKTIIIHFFFHRRFIVFPHIFNSNDWLADVILYTSNDVVKLFNFKKQEVVIWFNNQKEKETYNHNYNYFREFGFSVIPNFKPIFADEKIRCEELIENKPFNWQLAFPLVFKDIITYQENPKCLKNTRHYGAEITQWYLINGFTFYDHNAPFVECDYVQCFSFGDLHPGNLLFSGSRYYYIDFDISKYYVFFYDIFSFAFLAGRDGGDWSILKSILGGNSDELFGRLFAANNMVFDENKKDFYFCIFLYEMFHERKYPVIIPEWIRKVLVSLQLSCLPSFR